MLAGFISPWVIWFLAILMVLDDWYLYDDADVSLHKTPEILNLNGGNDWHTAYLLIYRKLELHPFKEEEEV